MSGRIPKTWPARPLEVGIDGPDPESFERATQGYVSAMLPHTENYV